MTNQTANANNAFRFSELVLDARADGKDASRYEAAILRIAQQLENEMGEQA